jgi:16S rRNA (uracil1498-N3)-methyltransferase
MFYAEQAGPGRARIQGETAEHLRRVLRVEIGQQYEISDGHNLYLGCVSGLPKGSVEFELAEELPARRQGAQITVYAALIKFDHFEWMLEKCSELGVDTLTPILAARSEAGLEKAAQKRHERWTRICQESGQQCRRVRPMTLNPSTDFARAIQSTAEKRLFLDETGGTPFLRALQSTTEAYALCTGPEGGWTAQERESALAAGWQAVTLGENILRAETATLAAVSQVQGYWWSLGNRTGDAASY